jgi:uncharacterized integral membrane protein
LAATNTNTEPQRKMKTSAVVVCFVAVVLVLAASASGARAALAVGQPLAGLPETCPADRVPIGYTNKNCTWCSTPTILLLLFIYIFICREINNNNIFPGFFGRHGTLFPCGVFIVGVGTTPTSGGCRQSTRPTPCACARRRPTITTIPSTAFAASCRCTPVRTDADKQCNTL